MRILSLFMVLSGLLMAPNCFAKEAFSQGRVIQQMGDILSHRQRIEPTNQLLKDRLENLLPRLMQETKVDMWLVINREYVEDALFFSLVPQPTFAARRTTILVIYDRGDNHPKDQERLERITVSRYPIKGYYESMWDGGSSQQQWQKLAEIIQQRDPKRIAINYSKDWALADGLTVGLHQQLNQYLPEKYQQRLVSAQDLVIRWMETRSQQELQIYPHIVSIARRVIAEAFSSQTITPGITTTEDVEWFIRERFESLQLKPWFQPHVNLQRKGDNNQQDAAFFGRTSTIIQQGDVLHTDVGICYLSLCTDTQEMGYVLRTAETDVPKGLKKALAKGNLWQDLLTEQFKLGRSGNEILASNLAAAKKAGLVATTYTHPIGFVGHAAGPTIGMWDNQGETPIKGDWKLNQNTAYAIEGNIKTQLPEWDNQWIQIKLEQTALFDGKKVLYLGGRQTLWHLVE